MVVRGGTGEVRLYWPEVGGIGLLGLLPLAYYLVDLATPILIEEIRLIAPDLVPEPLTTALAATLWIAGAALVAYVVTSDALVEVRTFESRARAESYLASLTMPPRQLLVDAGRILVGAVLVWWSLDGFVPSYELLVRTTVIEPGSFTWPFTVMDGVWLGAFLGGYLLLIGGIDRLIVHGLRRYFRRREVDDPDAEPA